MKLEFVQYNSVYLKSCTQLVGETWSIDDELINASQSRHLFYYFIRDCVDNSVYTDLIVDRETEYVLGILFASDQNSTTWKSSIKNLKNLLILYKHICLGHLGKRFVAWKFLKRMVDMNKSIEDYFHNFDSEIYLFIINKDLQGQGYGKILMDRFIEYCKNERKINSIYLWTDISCNYGFYQHYGFTLCKLFYDDRLSDHQDKRTDKPNGFVFCKKLI